MNSKTLLLKYLASIGNPDRAAALFAEDGVLELPFLRSLAPPTVHRLPGCGRGRDQVAPRKLQSIGDGAGATANWSGRYRHPWR